MPEWKHDLDLRQCAGGHRGSVLAQSNAIRDVRAGFSRAITDTDIASQLGRCASTARVSATRGYTVKLLSSLQMINAICIPSELIVAVDRG